MNYSNESGFENGRPVPTAPEGPLSLADKINDILDAHGCPPTDGLIAALVDLVDGHGFEAGGEMLRFFVASLPRSIYAVALARALKVNSDESLRESAKRLGVSHVALWKAERKIRAKLHFG